MTDPARSHEAARLFALPVALGLLPRAAALAAVFRAARRAAPAGDPRGLRTRLTHTLDDAVREIGLARARAAWRVRDALAPLLAARAEAAHLLAAGCAAAGEVVTPAEARLLVEHELRRHLRIRGAARR